MNYHDKVVLVTGGANGIGRAIGWAYLQQGTAVVFADIDEAKGRQLQDEYLAQGYKAFFYQIDLCNVEEIQQLFQTVMAKYQRIDILINNAGKGNFKSLYELSIAEWDEVINLNLRAAFVAAQQFARFTKGTGYGRIINIASTRYLMSEANTEAYAASKGGIVALTHALAISLSTENVTVNAISPGWIENNYYEQLTASDHQQHPSKRVGKPEDIAAMCLFLSDEKNDFINGENMVIDGGMTKKMIYV